MTENTVSSMCKSARAMGMSKRKWLQIEDHVSSIIRDSGPNFMISYLKDLKEYHEARLTGSDLPHLSWHKIDRKGRPTGWQTHLSFRKPKTSIQVIGAMVNSIEYDELQPNQISKWKDAVRNPTHVDVKLGTPFFSRTTRRSKSSADDRYDLLDRNYAYLETQYQLEEQLGLDHNGPRPKKPNRKKLQREANMAEIDRQLACAIADQSVFQPEDITGTSIPMFNSSLRIKQKRKKNGSVEKSLEQTLQAYVASINSAPAFAGQMEIDRIAMVKEAYPDLKIKDEEERLELAHKIKQRGQDLLVESWDDEPNEWITPRMAMNQRAGHIAFLQQAGGKLRAIANPNRYLQHLMRPLQGEISKVNNFPCVSLLDQEEGLRWASSKLKEGKTLHSHDLSSATDTLHADEFLENSRMGPLMRNETEYFNFASKAYWFSPDLQEDVNWDKGQPLGLAPSFSVLTLMNYTAGSVACLKAGIPFQSFHEHFRVVGDDFICTDDISDHYCEAITGMGGVLNKEKSLVSNTHGEFCSQIITASGHWPLKPKIRGTFDSIIIDSEKGSLNNVIDLVDRPQRFKKTAEYLSQFSSNDLRALPSIVSDDQRSYIERLGAATHLSVASRLKKSGVQEPRSIAVGPATSLSLEKAFEYPQQSNSELRNNLSGESPIDDILSHSSVRMNVDQQVKTYNHKLDDYEPVLDLMTQHSMIEYNLRDIEENSIVSDDKSVILIQTTDSVDHSSLSTLVDLNKGEIIVEGDTEDILNVYSVDLGEVYNKSSSGILPMKDFNDIYLSLERYHDKDLSL
nr:MAG: RNA-dependent RNA polymerase [Mitoviridae sp.]